MRLLVMAAAAMVVANAASAETLSFAKITFDDFNKGDPQSNGKLLFWLSGYYMGNDDDAIIDFDKMGKQGNALIQFCHDNPMSKLSDAAEKIMGKGK